VERGHGLADDPRFRYYYWHGAVGVTAGAYGDPPHTPKHDRTRLNIIIWKTLKWVQIMPLCSFCEPLGDSNGIVN